MQHILKKHTIWLILGIFALDAAFFSVTNPHQVSSIALIIGFLLLVATIYVISVQLFRVARLYVPPIGAHARRIALIVTVVSSTLLGLQSMGELSRRDFYVSLPLAAVVYAYISFSTVRGER